MDIYLNSLDPLCFWQCLIQVMMRILLETCQCLGVKSCMFSRGVLPLSTLAFVWLAASGRALELHLYVNIELSLRIVRNLEDLHSLKIKSTLRILEVPPFGGPLRYSPRSSPEVCES